MGYTNYEMVTKLTAFLQNRNDQNLFNNKIRWNLLKYQNYYNKLEAQTLQRISTFWASGSALSALCFGKLLLMFTEKQKHTNEMLFSGQGTLGLI